MYVVLLVLLAIALCFGLWATLHVDKKLGDE